MELKGKSTQFQYFIRVQRSVRWFYSSVLLGVSGTTLSQKKPSSMASYNTPEGDFGTGKISSLGYCVWLKILTITQPILGFEIEPIKTKAGVF